MLVAYVLTADFGANKAGDVVQLEQEQAQPLVDAGLLAEASAEDVGGGNEEEEVVDEAPVTMALNKLSTKINDTLVKATEIAVSKANRNRTLPSVPAQVKSGPVFKSVSDLMRTMYKAKNRNDTKAHNMLAAYEDERRVKAPSGVNTATAAEGGYTCNPEFSAEIWRQDVSQIKLLDECTVKPANGKTYTMRLNDMSSISNGQIFGGLQIYAVGEGNSMTASKPAFNSIDLTLQKYVGLVPYTTEVLEDTSYDLTSEISQMVAEAFTNKINVDLINADATSKEGVLATGSLVTVAKESSQVISGPLFYPNVNNMNTRLWQTSRPNAKWYINPELQTYLNNMTFPTSSGTASAFGAFTYNAADPHPYRLFGKPVVECWACPAPGSAGDIILADMKQMHVYLSDFQVDVSEHVNFTVGEVLYRFTLRLAFRSPWQQAVTGNTGSTSYSPFLVREALSTS